MLPTPASSLQHRLLSETGNSAVTADTRTHATFKRLGFRRQAPVGTSSASPCLSLRASSSSRKAALLLARATHLEFLLADVLRQCRDLITLELVTELLRDGRDRCPSALLTAWQQLAHPWTVVRMSRLAKLLQSKLFASSLERDRFPLFCRLSSCSRTVAD